MQILDPGHKYALNQLDGREKEILTFVKREGEKFPGNVGHYEGTNIQEVMRALIDRLKYLNNQVPDSRNHVIVKKLRDCIWLLEDRAAERHNRGFDFWPDNIELITTCKYCGHIGCEEYCNG